MLKDLKIMLVYIPLLPSLHCDMLWPLSHQAWQWIWPSGIQYLQSNKIENGNENLKQQSEGFNGITDLQKMIDLLEDTFYEVATYQPVFFNGQLSSSTGKKITTTGASKWWAQLMVFKSIPLVFSCSYTIFTIVSSLNMDLKWVPGGCF